MLHQKYRVIQPWYREDNKNATYKRGDTLYLRRHPIDESLLLVDKKENFVCMVHSENARVFTCGDDDNLWEQRSDKIMNIKFLCLIDNIKCRLFPYSLTVQKYNQNREDQSQPVIWNDDFYCASLEDLDKILFIFSHDEILPTDKNILICR